MKFALILLLACCATFTSAKSFGDVDCVSLVETELGMIPAGKWENAQACAKSVITAIVDLGSDLVASSNAAITNALKLKDLVMKCVNAGGTISQVTCVAKNIGEYKTTILQVIDDANELVDILKEKGVALVDAVKGCRLNDPVEVFMHLEALSHKMEQCPNF